MSKRPEFFIIDGHAFAYRQFHGLRSPAFRTSTGEPTNATFGFSRLLLDIMQKHKPAYVAVSFDRGLSGREKQYAGYKAQREDVPPDLIPQLQRIDQIVRAFNIPVLVKEDTEADDIIGTVAAQAEAQGTQMRIITGDRDLLQLLTPHVSVQLPKRGDTDVTYDETLFIEEYGLQPWQLVELKGLMGDSSDNIPGVKGIGQKTGTKLLQQYETVEGIYANIHAITGSTQKKLIEGEEFAYLSRDLARIMRDIDIEIQLDACQTQNYDHAEVLEIFRELEFRQFTDRVLNDMPAGTVTTSTGFTPPAPATEAITTVIVQDETTLNTLVEELNQAEAIVWDVESTSVDQMSAELVGIALATGPEKGYYIPIGHRQQMALFSDLLEENQIPLETVLEALRSPLTNPNIPKIAHNASYDLVMMQRYGIDVHPISFDTMIAEWTRDPVSKFLGLKNFSYQYMDIQMQEISDLIGKGAKQITMADVAIADAAPYAAADAAVTYRAYEYLKPKLEEEPSWWTLYNSLEMPLIPVIAEMEQAGVLLDTAYLAGLSARLDEQLQKLEIEIHKMSGGYGPFNINSPKQLNDVLFGKLGLPVAGLRKTVHGYSTDAAVLETLNQDHPHPILQLILDHRELMKLKGTYVDALPQLVNPKTGRLHTSYNQTGTSTGRLSSSNPNLQNIPIRSEIGREVRRAFITAPGTQLLSVDYSQIELRVLAHISEDATLLEAFAQNQDIHAATAATVYGVPIESVTYEQRDFAKRVNFGLIYGMGAFRLARDSDLTLAESTAFIETYFSRLPGVKHYLDGVKEQARKGAVTTLLGRRREFPALLSAGRGNTINHNTLQAEERVAVNLPIQGTAAEIMKKAMIDLHAELQTQEAQARMILQVHDEIVLEVPENELADITRRTVDIMEAAFTLKAPLRANAEIGLNWRDMHAAPL
jgi:DNA polymerase-1